MAVTDQELTQAEESMATIQQAGYAVAARYDQSAGRVVVTLNTEVEISFPARSAEGLANASPDDLSAIEMSPSGLGLHRPNLDADLYVQSLVAAQLRLRVRRTS